MPQLSITVQGQGPEMVLLHGWGMNAAVWSPLLPGLVNHYRVTCIDLPGHGGSTALDGNTLPDWLAALAQVAPPRAIWVGWSLGGMLALAFASRYSARVRQLVSVAANLRFVADAAWPDAIAPAQLREVASGVVDDPAATLRRFVALQFMGGAMSREVLRRVQAAVTQPLPDRNALAAGLELLRLIDNREGLAELEVPLTMIFGEHDKLVPLSVIAAIRRLDADSDIRVIPGAGHAPFLSHPDAFLKVLRESLPSDHG
jgi:pimeloyl-[acyl-carrier protein] methyl ester esterase